MSAILKFEQHLETLTCYSCGVVFAVPSYFKTKRLEDSKSFWCPNGHSQAFVESEVQRLKKQLEEQKRSTEWQRARAQRLEKDLQSQKGQMTKLKNRVAKGVCPCCKRSFQALARHIKTKHPDYKGEGE